MLSRVKQRYWSVLPLTPTNVRDFNSPYKTSSAFAGNTLLISPEFLMEEGLVSRRFTRSKPALPARRVDYAAVSSMRNALLKRAYENFTENRSNTTINPSEFEDFRFANTQWLEDYALYKALRKNSRKPWYAWPNKLRDREPLALARKKRNMKRLVEQEEFEQFLFFRQWRSLKDFCAEKGVSIIGDLSFYVGYDSADVWSHPEIFKLDAHKKPTHLGGVPPDYFSKRGQLWDNPVYDWRELKETGFDWWMRRIRHNLELFDVLRLDHFRGFTAYWQIPAATRSPKTGKWIRAPSESFFKALEKSFPSLPFIAEDLGVITRSVRKAIKQLGLQGMNVLLFAFDGNRDNPHLPRNHLRNSVVFTGTHDTNTVRGWFTQEATAEEKQEVLKLIGRKISAKEVSGEFIKLAMASPACLSIIPAQDVLSLGAEARMNHPAKQRGNWEWRAAPSQITYKKLGRVKELTEAFGRDGC